MGTFKEILEILLRKDVSTALGRHRRVAEYPFVLRQRRERNHMCASLLLLK